MGAKNLAVILSGCGVYDGAEVSESVLTLLALEKAGCIYKTFAIDAPQAHVIDHTKGEPVEGAERNMLVEAARIVRGQIQSLDQLNLGEFDAVVFPGGFGAAKNLCTLGFDGADYTVRSDVEQVLHEAHAAGKVIGVMCIAPALAAAALGAQSPELTIGNDAETGAALESKGATLVEQPVSGVVVDRKNKLVSTPAFMLAQNLLELEGGVNAFVEALVGLLD